MFNAQDIIELEKKWLIYKVKQKSSLYIFILFIILILSFVTYAFYFPNVLHVFSQNKEVVKMEKPKKIVKPKKIEKHITTENNNTITNKNIIKIPAKEQTKPTKVAIKKDNSKPYYFKLEPTEQSSELFSSNGFLTLNIGDSKKEQELIKKDKVEVVEPINEIPAVVPKQEIKKKKTKISINMQEMDTIAYLKDKYYSTSSIVFALMLAEEYYYDKKYKDALKWALTANDIDSQNTKSWYWFAKSKVKLNKREDAIRALRAYLSNNESKRLSTLLNKIELGDTND